MRLLRRRTPAIIPDPPPLPTDITHGLRTLADDIDNGNVWAINFAFYIHEATPGQIAAYPTCPNRIAHIPRTTSA
ncbi:hypothetical protein SUDANB145_07233 (plasmid) [Streptomyces sp. enrichment culture]|uniref:hypothetical protein n=1 Tax=Streptomyces sp. enrichment culture TaxID=1795815 RepID=UPI003F54866E